MLKQLGAGVRHVWEGMHIWLPYVLVAGGFLVVAFVTTKHGQEWVLATRAKIEPLSSIAATFMTSDVLRELSLALVIVGLVTISVERARVKTFSEQLSRAVDQKLAQIEETTRDAIVAGPLPKAYYEQIKQVILLNRFLRPEWTMTIRFVPLDKLQGFVSFSFEQVYSIKNLHGFETKYVVEHWESCDWEDKCPGTTCIRYVKAKYEGADAWLFEEQAEIGITLGVREDSAVRFKKPISIPTNQVLVVHEGSTKVMRDRGYEAISISEPTMGAKFWVECPEDLVVEITIPEIHPDRDKHVVKGKKEPMEGGRIRTYWEFHSAMPPFSYFIVDWRKDEKNASAQKVKTMTSEGVEKIATKTAEHEDVGAGKKESAPAANRAGALLGPTS